MLKPEAYGRIPVEEAKMGLFKSLKDAGAKLLGGKAQAATPDAL